MVKLMVSVSHNLNTRLIYAGLIGVETKIDSKWRREYEIKDGKKFGKET